MSISVSFFLVLVDFNWFQRHLDMSFRVCGRICLSLLVKLTGLEEGSSLNCCNGSVILMADFYLCFFTKILRLLSKDVELWLFIILSSEVVIKKKIFSESTLMYQFGLAHGSYSGLVCCGAI
ncbi:hypothetical protein Bca101_018325 [Brassica carinata]